MGEATRPVEQILDLARWAPSGDNTQPWRFEIVADDHVVVHGFDTRRHCVYDLDGRPSQMALGALLETIEIAASGHGLRVLATRRTGFPEEQPTFDVRFVADSGVRPSPLIPCVTVRSVQRRPLSTRPLTGEQKAGLKAVVGPDYQLVWFEHPSERWRVAKVMFHNAKIRLTIREAYEVHRAVIEWAATCSRDRVPDRAVGLDPLTLMLMRWVMQSWDRVEFFNRWLAGTLMPRVQMDLIPGVACAAHLALVSCRPATTIDDFVAGGRAMQRLWLEVTRVGLLLQPEMTPVIFSRYLRDGRAFTVSASGRRLAAEVSAGFNALLGADVAQRAVFVARVGLGKAARARSTRLPLPDLMVARRTGNKEHSANEQLGI